jgi:hypothetical protein
MSIKNKPAIIVAALLSVASSVMAAQARPQAQAFADPVLTDVWATGPDNRQWGGLPTDPYPNGVPGVSEFYRYRSYNGTGW